MDYLAINKKLWNERTKVHYPSDFYNVDGFLNGESPLNSIELDLLGDVRGKKILHLQCHFGLDSLALARLGAEVTGVDFSEEAINHANQLAEQANLKADFICCDIYSLPRFFDGEYDIVFTSYGTIGWLPDLDQWAFVINRFLKPGGSFVFAEFHPVLWMYDDDFENITYSYFKQDEIVETLNDTYTEGNIIPMQCVSWNHSIAEVISSLLKQNLVLKNFEEYDYSPYDCFKGTKKLTDRTYIIERFGQKIPMVYALKANKPLNN